MGESSKEMNEAMSARVKEDPLRGARPDQLFGIGSNNDSCPLITVGVRGGVRATFVRLSCPEKQAKSNMLQINFQAQLLWSEPHLQEAWEKKEKP